jgi:branched-chain amino acid transport system permease protein
MRSRPLRGCGNCLTCALKWANRHLVGASGGRPPKAEVTGGLLENILNAVAAGLIIGCLYGPTCIGLGLIFGTMSVVNLAQVERLMLSLYISLYLVTGFAAIGFLGPYAAPFVAALIAGRCCFGGGALLQRFLSRHMSDLSTVSRLDQGGFGWLIVTLGVSLILQNGGLGQCLTVKLQNFLQ